MPALRLAVGDRGGVVKVERLDLVVARVRRARPPSGARARGTVAVVARAAGESARRNGKENSRCLEESRTHRQTTEATTAPSRRRAGSVEIDSDGPNARSPTFCPSSLS